MTEDTFTLDFAPEEIVLLLRLFEAPPMLGVEDPFRGMLVEEIQEELTKAKDSLATRDYISVAADGEVSVDGAVAGLVGGCMFPQGSLVVTYQAPGSSPDIRYYHFTEDVVIEQAGPEPDGRYRLTALRTREVAHQRVLEQLHLSAQPAAPGTSQVLPENQLRDARKVAVEKGAEEAAEYLGESGLDSETAAALGQTLASPTCNCALALIRQECDETKTVTGFGLLEGPRGLWLLHALGSPESPQVELSPCSAEDAISKVNEFLGLTESAK